MYYVRDELSKTTWHVLQLNDYKINTVSLTISCRGNQLQKLHVDFKFYFCRGLSDKVM